jgi:hypothetical protein
MMRGKKNHRGLMARASKGSCFQTLGFIHNAMQYRCGRPAIEPIISRFAPSSKYTPKFPAHQSPRVPIALGVLNSAHSPSDRAWRNRIFNLGTSPYSHPNEKKKSDGGMAQFRVQGCLLNTLTTANRCGPPITELVPSKFTPQAYTNILWSVFNPP